jgi:hypothetical protein
MAYVVPATSSETLLSIALSSSPVVAFWLALDIESCIKQLDRRTITLQWHHLLLSELCATISIVFWSVSGSIRHTVSCPDFRIDVLCLTNQYGSVWIVLLHGRICSGEERSGTRSVLSIWQRERSSYRVAALWSEVWQRWKRSSLRPWRKAYLDAMARSKGC